MADADIFRSMPPEVAGLACAVMWLTGALIKSGTIDREAVADFPARMDKIASEEGLDGTHREKMIAVMRCALRGMPPPKPGP